MDIVFIGSCGLMGYFLLAPLISLTRRNKK